MAHKKSKLISLVCHESFFIEAPSNTWWTNSDSTIYIFNTMQDFPSLRKLKGNEEGIYSGNQMRSKVKAIGTFRLVLKFRLILNLKNIFYILSFSRNLILVSRVYNIGYGFFFINCFEYFEK
jgi:hypothetical protein